MQLKALTKSKVLVEVVTSILLIIFLVYPVAIPDNIANIVESSLGMTLILSIVVFLFIYSNIFTSVLFLFVAYELIRRSSKATSRSSYIQYTPTQRKRDQLLKDMNEPITVSLEEDVVSKMAPINVSNVESTYIESTFKPVSSDVHNAYTF